MASLFRDTLASPALRAHALSWQRTDEAGRQCLREELLEVMDWLAGYTQPAEPLTSPWSAWVRYMRHCKQQQQQMLLTPLPGSQWLQRVVSGDGALIIEPLRTVAQYAQESHAMSHCLADRYTVAAREGRFLAWSLLDGTSRTRVATVGITLECDGPSLQIAGPCNAEICERLGEVVLGLLTPQLLSVLANFGAPAGTDTDCPPTEACGGAPMHHLRDS